MNDYELKLYDLLETARQYIDRAEMTKNSYDFIEARKRLNEAKEMILTEARRPIPVVIEQTERIER